MAKYIVTGCAGFIGSHLSERLVRDGHEVVGIDAFTDYYDPALKEANLAALGGRDAFSLVRGDLVTLDLEPLVAGTDGVFHLAAQPGVRASWMAFDQYLSRNLHATQSLFEAAAGAGVRVAWASSSSVYGSLDTFPTTETDECRPISPYGVTKLACERLAYAYARSHGLEACGLRYFTVYGPRQRPDMAFTRIARGLVSGGTFPVFGSGEQSRDFTYVEDAVEATVAVLERGVPGTNYNVGGGEEATLNGVIGLFEELAGRRLDVQRQGQAVGDMSRTCADTSRLRSDTGWSPRTALRDGIARQLEWASQPTTTTS